VYRGVTDEIGGIPIEVRHQREATNVGDLNSDAKGTGARKNEGKTPYSLVPIKVMAETILRERPDSPVAKALFLAGCYQSTQDVFWLYEIATTLGLDGWEDCARVFEYGMKKYKAWNWAKGMPWTIPFECIVRHLLAMLDLKLVDDESKLPHRGHVFCNIAMLVSYSKTYPEGNDLPPVGMLA
jgi:hypothetical protein